MRTAADLYEELSKAGLPVVSCDSARNVELEKNATVQQKQQAQSIAFAFDFSIEKVAVPPLTEKEILWVRKQMKAEADAVR